MEEHPGYAKHSSNQAIYATNVIDAALKKWTPSIKTLETGIKQVYDQATDRVAEILQGAGYTIFLRDPE
jgi:hypothetical protein